MSKGKGIEAVGWGFWLVVFFLSLAPCIYVIRINTYESEGWLTPVLLGSVMAAIGAGVLSVIANSLLQLVNSRRGAASDGEAGGDEEE